MSIAIAVTAAFTMSAAPVSAAWVQTGSRWWYQNADGSYPRNGWANISKKWYLFDSAGYMLTGWQQVNGVWYYLNPAGDMATGWKLVGNTWYYLDASGAMKTGWQKINNVWYYFLSWGGMVTGSHTIDGVPYSFSSSGALIGEAPSSSVAPEGETRVVFWGETVPNIILTPNAVLSRAQQQTPEPSSSKSSRPHRLVRNLLQGLDRPKTDRAG